MVVVVAGGFWWFRDAARRRRAWWRRPPASPRSRSPVSPRRGSWWSRLCNVNRAHFGVIDGLPFIIPIVLAVFSSGPCCFSAPGSAATSTPSAATLRRRGEPASVWPPIRTWGFVLAGLTSGIAGILFASWQVFLHPDIIKSANAYVLLAVAAAVIGGTSLFGGRGRTLHGVLGGLIIGGIYNGL